MGTLLFFVFLISFLAVAGITVWASGQETNGTSGLMGFVLLSWIAFAAIMVMCIVTYLVSLLVGWWALLLWPAAAFYVWTKHIG